MKKYSFYLILSITLIFSCKSVDNGGLNQFTEAPLLGMIYDSESSPIAGAEVILDDGKPSQTDINGRFMLDSVSRARHSVRIRKKGYEEVQMVPDFSNRDQVLYSTLISLENILDKLSSSLGTGKISEAESFLERASKIDSDDIRFRYLNVVYLSEVKKYTSAYKKIVLLRKAYPNDVYIVMTQAKILFYGLGKKTEALAVMRDFSLTSKNEEFESLMIKMNSEIDAGETIQKEAGEISD